LGCAALLTGFLVLGAGETTPVGPPQAELQDTEERLGPFTLGPFALPRQSFTVVLHGKRLPGASGADSEALAALEIRDASDVVRHREEFAEGCSASVELLTGNVAAGLLIGAGCLPSAPGSGDTWEIFGVVDGKLVRFGKPFTTSGEPSALVPTPVRRSGTAVVIQPDTIPFRVWTGNVHVTLPVRVDWLGGRVMQGLRCRDAGCELPAEAERIPVDQELTFVRLFAEASEESGVARHVVVKRDSRVEILAAKAKLLWDDRSEVIQFGVADDDPWLRVRIDDQEGWIHTQEDFLALGVPQAG